MALLSEGRGQAARPSLAAALGAGPAPDRRWQVALALARAYELAGNDRLALGAAEHALRFSAGRSWAPLLDALVFALAAGAIERAEGLANGLDQLGCGSNTHGQRRAASDLTLRVEALRGRPWRPPAQALDWARARAAVPSSPTARLLRGWLACGERA